MPYLATLDDPHYWCRDFRNFIFDKALALVLEQAEQVSDPERAELFFVPSYLVSMLQFEFIGWINVTEALGPMLAHDKAIVDFMRKVGPYWDRHGGADHLVSALQCGLIGSPLDQAYPQLWNRTIKACLHGVAHGVYTSRDIHVPYYQDPSFSPYTPRPEVPPHNRSHSVYFSGSIMPGREWVEEGLARIPQSLFLPIERWGQEFSDRNALITEVLRNMSQSQFVLVPVGDSPESLRFQQAIEVGAIPIVVSDMFQYPFEDYIPWKSFTVQLPERMAAEGIQAFVAKMTDERLASLYEQLVKYRRVLHYRKGPGMVPDMVLQSACKALNKTAMG